MIDEFYCSDSLIISKSKDDKETPLMVNNRRLIERITAIKVAIEDDYDVDLKPHLVVIANLLEERNMNFNEFTSFFPSLDVSYSIYKKLSTPEKFNFLQIAVRKYIEKRHSIYISQGYSATTLQVRKDFEKHKTEGGSAKKKVEGLLSKHGFKELGSSESIIDNPLKYHFFGTSIATTNLIDDLRVKVNLRFEWQAVHQNKSADVVFSDRKGNIYISELKHTKETGGGQDKQVSELISLISFTEDSPKIRYLSFLDGIYFNTFISPTAPKTIAQVEQIKGYLVGCKKNFFVNTYGLEQVLMDNVTV
ncbi:hypothetical protein [Polynucleobacter sp. MWH-UH2A]|uniref:hypothetical protein n=1 Tax=Polynucleobacter sp. MWH-UH2A TaxID=1855617 RepID=UPI001BFD61B9|nr:hypothetical protein [Polynucleobacter sp. MWH-UH2A]QWD63370.1 hypothetical protein IC571_06625 [Polynucleobacter sp. MWH-UH2A]